MQDARIGEGVRVLLLGSGKAGHEINAVGVAEALGAPYELKRVNPRKPFLWMSPFGPVDPRDAALFAPPLPDIVLASGRVTVPYLRAFKRARRRARVRGVSPRPALRPRVDGPDLGSRTRPPSRAQRDLDADLAASVLAAPARGGARRARRPARRAAGAALRRRARRPERRAAFHRRRPGADDGGGAGDRRPGLFDHGDAVAPHAARTRRRGARRARRRAGLRLGRTSGDNPYASILALADAVLVTGDSANMVGEATATGAPVHVFEPSGGDAGKLGQGDRRAASGSARSSGSPAGSSASPMRRSIRAASSPPRSPAASPAPAPRRREQRWSGQGRIIAATDFGGGPAIVLVRPQLAVNIGMCARAMANFGLDDLRLVAPREGWPRTGEYRDVAYAAAAGAAHLLDGARVYADRRGGGRRPELPLRVDGARARTGQGGLDPGGGDGGDRRGRGQARRAVRPRAHRPRQ